MITLQQLVVIGAGGHAVSLSETIRAIGFKIAAFVDEFATSAGTFHGAPLLPVLPQNLEPTQMFALATGDNYIREKLMISVRRQLPGAHFPTLVHPSAIIARSSILGVGTVVLQGAIVGAYANVADGCLINSGAIVEHECRVESFASLGPGAKLGGGVTVGVRSAISIGAVVKHGIFIGENTVVGAASYVHSDLPPGVVAFGVPATIRRHRRPADPYLA